jgi:hypothetical protein
MARTRALRSGKPLGCLHTRDRTLGACLACASQVAGRGCRGSGQVRVAGRGCRGSGQVRAARRRSA